MSIKRFNAEGFNANENEYEVRYPGEQQYSSIDKDSLVTILEDGESRGDIFLGGLRYRLKDSTDPFTRVDRKDIGQFLEALKGMHSESEECQGECCEECCEERCDGVPMMEEDESRQEVVDGICRAPPMPEDDAGTVFKVCCQPMMKALLGGERHVLISLETGRIQLGNDAMSYCPFCGKPITTYDPPIEVIPPE